MKLACPKCGHDPAISLWKRCLLPFLGGKSQPHCCQCGTPLDTPASCNDLLDGAVLLSFIPAWFLAQDRLALLVVPLLTLFLGNLVSAFLVPLASTLPEDQECIPPQEMVKMKTQLTCPKCGKAPVMSPISKAQLFFRSKPRCPWCGTPLSNPSWFDFARIAVLIGVVILTARYTRSRTLPFLALVAAAVLTGLISLYCIPLQKHWNVTGDD